MARTPIAPHLIHDPAEVARDLRVLEMLVGLALPVAREETERAFRRCSADTAANALAAESAELARELLEETATLPAAERELAAELSRALQSDMVTTASAGELDAYARNVASVMVREWVSLIHQVVESAPVALNEALLPSRPEHRDRLALLLATLNPMVVGRDEAAAIMRSLRDRLLGREQVARLPHRLVLEVRARDAGGNPRQVVARREL